MYISMLLLTSFGKSLTADKNSTFIGLFSMLADWNKPSGISPEIKHALGIAKI